MIKNLYLSLEKYKMLFLKAYSEKKGVKVKFTEENKIEIVKQFLSFISECVENTLYSCGINPKRFPDGYSKDLRYKILAIALKKNITISTNRNSIIINFILGKSTGFSKAMKVGLEYGDSLYIDYAYVRYAQAVNGMDRYTPYPVDSERENARNYIFDMITSEYLENFVNMLNLIEALNNDVFAKIILKLNNSLEETILPRYNYDNPHNRGFWFRVFRRNEFERERDEHLSSKLKIAERLIEGSCYVENAEVLDRTPLAYSQIKWAIDYMGWECFYTKLQLPANYFFIDKVTPLNITTEFRRND